MGGRDQVEKKTGRGIAVVGAGLAGSEAALTVARFGLPVTLYEMKPGEMTPAHSSPDYAELVCSNSLKSDRPDTAQGLLKRELRSLGCHLLAIADQMAVPAGGSLAVDRDLFSGAVSEKIRENPLIRLIEKKVESVEELLESHSALIVASGPLTAGGLYESIQAMTGGEGLHFFDAVAPIVEGSSIDRAHSFLASRYDKGGADYLNCPLSREDYQAFQEGLVGAEKAPVHNFDPTYFKDCQPIEVLAARGEDTLRFGPLRPVGLTDPTSGERPYACLQLRKEDKAGAMWSLVGCQTRLTFPEQRRVFGIIPALREAVYLRYGVMHRNSFLKGPLVLERAFQSKKDEKLFFAGQLSGLEGYVEAIGSGLISGIQAVAQVLGLPEEDKSRLLPPPETMIGALTAWVTGSDPQSYQPMNANFGLLPLEGKEGRVRKKDRGRIRTGRSDAALTATLSALEALLPGDLRHDP